MDRAFSIPSLAASAGPDPVRACRVVDEDVDLFGAFLLDGAEGDNSKALADEEPAIPADPVPAIAIPAPPVESASTPPMQSAADEAGVPLTATPNGISLAETVAATGAGSSETAAQAGLQEKAASPPVEAATAGQAQSTPATATRRSRARPKPAVAAEDGQQCPARSERRASRVGWVKGGTSSAEVPAASCVPGKGGGARKPMLPTAGAGMSAAPPSADIVTSLRWIADPTPPRSAAMPPQIATPMPRPAHDTPPLKRSVTAELAATGPSPSGETELALDLAELGPVRLRIRDRRGRLALHVLADHPATLDLLRRHADELTGALQEAGLAGASLSWGRTPGPARPPKAAAPATTPETPAPDSPPLVPGPRRDGDLDLLF